MKLFPSLTLLLLLLLLYVTFSVWTTDDEGSSNSQKLLNICQDALFLFFTSFLVTCVRSKSWRANDDFIPVLFYFKGPGSKENGRTVPFSSRWRFSSTNNNRKAQNTDSQSAVFLPSVHDNNNSCSLVVRPTRTQILKFNKK